MAKSKSGVGGTAGGTQIDTTGFVEFCRKLANQMDATFPKVLNHEMMKVLGTAAKKTLRTTVDKAGGKYNPGSKFFKGWVRMNNKFYYVGKSVGGKTGFKYSPSMWTKLQARLKANRKRAETRVALSKASYYRVAALLKLPRYSKAFEGRVRTPYVQSGGLGKSGGNSPIWARTISASKNLRSNDPVMKFSISSTNTFNPFTKGAGALQSALNGRAKHFEHAIADGWEATASDLAKHYKGIEVR